MMNLNGRMMVLLTLLLLVVSSVVTMTEGKGVGTPPVRPRRLNKKLKGSTLSVSHLNKNSRDATTTSSTTKHKGSHRHLKSKGGGGGGDGGGIDIPDIPDIGDITVCFSDRSTVSVQGVSTPVPMKDLEVGAKVLTNDGSYQTMYAWGHKKVDQTANFVQLYGGSNGNKHQLLLEVSPRHLVFLDNNPNVPVPAESIKLGDKLATTNGPVMVKKIRSRARQGVYAPLTSTGTIVVDGIHASSYIALQGRPTATGKDSIDSAGLIHWKRMGGIHFPMSHQDFVHTVLSPYRMFCLGIGTSYCQDTSTTSDGIPLYAQMGMDLVSWAEQEDQSLLIQLPLMVASVMVFATAMLLENTLGGPTIAPFVILVLGSVLVAMKMMGLSVRGRRINTTTPKTTKVA